MGYPRGLVRYTTENILTGKATHVIRPRIIVYAIILTLISISTFTAIMNRTPLALDVIRDRNTLFRETNDGLIENVYTLKIMNMDSAAHDYSLSVTGIDGLEMKMDMFNIEVESGHVIEVPVRAIVDPDKLKSRSSKISFNLIATDSDDLYVTEEARFLGPRLER